MKQIWTLARLPFKDVVDFVNKLAKTHFWQHQTQPLNMSPKCMPRKKGEASKQALQEQKTKLHRVLQKGARKALLRLLFYTMPHEIMELNRTIKLMTAMWSAYSLYCLSKARTQEAQVNQLKVNERKICILL